MRSARPPGEDSVPPPEFRVRHGSAGILQLAVQLAHLDGFQEEASDQRRDLVAVQETKRAGRILLEHVTTDLGARFAYVREVEEHHTVAIAVKTGKAATAVGCRIHVAGQRPVTPSQTQATTTGSCLPGLLYVFGSDAVIELAPGLASVPQLQADALWCQHRSERQRAACTPAA